MVVAVSACQGTITGPPGDQGVGAATGGGATATGSGASSSGGSGASLGSSGGSTAQGGSSGAAGSSGGSGTSATAGTSGSSSVGTDPSTLCAAQAGMLQVGLTKLRRMTRDELNHTLRDLLGVTGTPADALAPDESIGPFYSNAIAPITALLVQQHDEIAASLADAALPQMATLAGCDLATDPACPANFIESFGLKAYRRPLEMTERDEYLALYTTELAAGTPQSAFTLVLSTLLESPFFLYHYDVGTSGVPSATPVALTSYELASRLSYFLWETMPDDELFALAATDSLKDDAVIAAQVERMLASTKASDSIPQFHVQWLGLRNLVGSEKDSGTYPSWNDAMATAMLAETRTFTDYVIRQGDGLLRTLLTADFSYPQGPLFGLYGLAQPAGFVAGTQVMLNTAERAGLLTQASFLTAHAHRDSSSPVHRGIAIRENFLCQPLESPPPGVNMTVEQPGPGATIRDVLAAHEANASCGGCHRLIDPIGLAFENYDGVGAFRTSWNADGTLPVDAAGEILDGGDDLAGTFDGAVELGHKLAESQTVADCVANQWFRYALGRMEAEDDACSIQAIHAGFASSGNNVRQLIVNIVKSESFQNVRATAVTP